MLPIPAISLTFHTDVLVRSFRSVNVVRGGWGKRIAPFLTSDVQSSVRTSALASPPESPVLLSQHNLDYADPVGMIMRQMGMAHAVSAFGEARDSRSLC
jgi:hypothetical protein